MRILIWATTLQADILSLAWYLDQREDVDLLISAEGVDAFLQEPISKALRFKSKIIGRFAPDAESVVKSFNADVTLFDNHFPPFKTSSKICSMWHGLGWKARGKKDIANFLKKVREWTGVSARAPNPYFLTQCYGKADFNWRVQKWGVHPDNCKVIGMAFTDLLLNPPIQKSELIAHYHMDIENKKTVLLSFTWHYGRIWFQNNDQKKTWLPFLSSLKTSSSAMESDQKLLRFFIEFIVSKNANVLLCLHDKHRFDPNYLRAWMDVAESYSASVQIQFKNEHPDNLSDLLVSDVMASNLSSFITYFYHLKRPSIHLLPFSESASGVRFAQKKFGRLGFRNVRRGEDVWMNRPEDNGGFLVRNVEGAKEALERSLRDPLCCEEKSNRWIEGHIFEPDGNTCERFYQTLVEFVSN